MLRVWQFLQPILFVYTILSTIPGRDTQDTAPSTVDSTIIDDFVLDSPPLVPQDSFFNDYTPLSDLYYWMFLSVFTPWLSSLIGCLQTGRAFLYVMSSLFLLGLILLLPRGKFNFTRKHGRWRYKRFFPSCFLLLSCVSLDFSQVTCAIALQPGRGRHRISLTTLPRSVVGSEQVSNPSWEELFLLVPYIRRILDSRIVDFKALS